MFGFGDKQDGGSIPVKVSLSTHTVYPEILADVQGRPPGFVSAKLIERPEDRTGPEVKYGSRVVDTFEGIFGDRQAAINAAIAWVQSKQAKYLREKG